MSDQSCHEGDIRFKRNGFTEGPERRAFIHIGEKRNDSLVIERILPTIVKGDD